MDFGKQFLNQFLSEVGQRYKQADQRLGGWLPGGGVASPITRAVFPPQVSPGRSEELERITGVKGRFINTEQTPTLIRRLAPFINPRWGQNDYANPILSEIGITDYKGGATPGERQMEFHELGHLDKKDKELYSYLGVLGRSLQGLSGQVGNAPLVDLAAGLALQHADAPEEDRAERFAKKYSKAGNYPARVVYTDGTSGYGNTLRREGQELVTEAVNRMADPFGVVSGAAQVLNQQRSKSIRAEMSQLEPELKRLLVSSGDQMPPELFNLNKRYSELYDQLKALNPQGVQ
jgi:hypothetical protein